MIKTVITDPLTARAMASRDDGHFVFITPTARAWMCMCAECGMGHHWKELVHGSWLTVEWRHGEIPMRCAHCGEWYRL